MSDESLTQSTTKRSESRTAQNKGRVTDCQGPYGLYPVAGALRNRGGGDHTSQNQMEASALPLNMAIDLEKREISLSEAGFTHISGIVV